MDKDVGIQVRDAFNVADGASTVRHDTIALMIDIQQGMLFYMDRNEIRGYLDHMRHVLDDLRQKGVPVGWVSIGEQSNQLYKPETGNLELRGAGEITSMNFFHTDVPGTAIANQDLFEDFMKTHGPRKNEVMFCKNTFSALDENESGLKHYLKEQEGLSKIILSGGTANFCVGSTANDAVNDGFTVIVASDNLIGWAGNEDASDYKYGKAVWQGEDHVAKIKEKFGEIMDLVRFSTFNSMWRQNQEKAMPSDRRFLSARL